MSKNKHKVLGGCTLWARKTINSDIFSKKPAIWFKIWFYIVNRANHKDNKQFRRGQCHLTYEIIMLACGATKAQVDHCMRWFKSCRMCATQKATRGFIITVCNYGRYQDLLNYQRDSSGDSKATQKRQRSDTINNNENNGNNDKYIYSANDLELSRLLFKLLQEKRPNLSEPNFPMWANEIRKLREIDGRTPKQIKAVIEWSQADDFWWDKVMSTASLRKKSREDNVKRIDRIEIQMQKGKNGSDKISRQFAEHSEIGETIEA